MSTRTVVTCLPVPKLNASVRSGLRQINAEMVAVADVKAGDTAIDRRDAKHIRAALDWISAWETIVESSK